MITLQFLRRSFLLSILALLASKTHLFAQTIGTMNPTQKFTVQSKILNDTRQISLYKPSLVEEFPDNVPPVIYVLDGEITMELVRGQVGYFTEIWKELPPIMVVGIENNHNMSNRTHDLTPTKSALGNGGGADQFMEFLQEEVIPTVEKDHKKRPYRVLVGSSLGGLFAVHSLLNYNVFDAFIASSPTLAWNNSSIMGDLAEKLEAVDRRIAFFFGVANEGGKYLPHAKTLDSLLQKKQSLEIRHRFTHYPDEAHGTAPLKSYYDGFKFIFRVGPEDLGLPLEQVTYKHIEDYYKDWTSIFGFPMKPREVVINEYGYKFLYGTKQIERALEFFEMNIRNYPNSANAYDSYAQALVIKGDREKALANYEKSLALNPGNKGTRQRLEKLKDEMKR